MSFFHTRRFKDLQYIVSRNVFVLTNGILGVVVVLLFIFGDTSASIFLGLVLIINIILGLGQDIRAWFALEKLQILTTPRVIRIDSDHTEHAVLLEEIKKEDLIKLKTGDQVPCDGVLVEGSSLELNEGLITGEATSFSRKEGEQLLAGSIITAGSGTMRALSAFTESRIARMTEGIKSYSVTQSPIQRAVQTVIVYSGYVLLCVIVYVFAHGFFTHEPYVLMVKEIGALASMIVPQGLSFAMTLLFAYGAAHLFRKNVLLQEVNATEKLGRIKNLCMDKTGTLTENILVVERMDIPPTVTKEEALRLTGAYIAGSDDSSQTIDAIKVFTEASFQGTVSDVLPFSSWRSYGAVYVKDEKTFPIIFAGAPECFLPYMSEAKESEWLTAILDTETKRGKRVFVITRSSGTDVHEELSAQEIHLVAVYVFSAKLRPGILEAIAFFQKRGVRIRIISGDHPETVRAIAMSAGVHQCEAVITGSTLKNWSAEDYTLHTREYTIFARVLPEQKEKIIESLKKDGFTAMVGDGANDALAIKKADLGIAMWQGAPATRQIASVVLMNNSFTDLPGGVELADSIIKNAEIFASIFFGASCTGFFLFLVTSMLGYPYPLSPLNITLINYFVVGIPGILVSYWTIRPAEKTGASSGHNFLSKVLPYIIFSSALQAIAISILFLRSPELSKTTGTNMSVLLASIATGMIFFFFAPKVYRGALVRSQTYALWATLLGEILLFIAGSHIPFLLKFFDVTEAFPTLSLLVYPGIILTIYGVLQYFLARVYRIKIEKGSEPSV